MEPHQLCAAGRAVPPLDRRHLSDVAADAMAHQTATPKSISKRPQIEINSRVVRIGTANVPSAQRRQ